MNRLFTAFSANAQMFIFVASVIALVLISSITYRHTVALTTSTELVTKTHQIHTKLEQLISFLKDAETGSRGFILTKDSVFLEPFQQSLIEVETDFNELKGLTIDNIEQQKNLDTLRSLIVQKYQYMAQVRQRIQKGTIAGTEIHQQLLAGKIVMDEIRRIIDKMIALEMSYLKMREGKYQYELSFTPFFMLLLFGFSGLIFLLSFGKIMSDVGKLRKINDQLLLSNEAMEHAEGIDGFGTWYLDMTTQKLHYSDNLYRILGCEPQSFEANLENFVAFVHPDDQAYLRKAFLEITTEKLSKSRFFRIVRKDGALRYFKSIGKTLMNLEGKIVLIGLTSDITDEHLSQLALQQEKKTLQQSNQELTSFNHIASHDLQEPLRKIQTFISLIKEKDETQLSPTSQVYFDKVQTAAARMRQLIDDLLIFAKASKSEAAFKRTNLNILLEYAKQELAHQLTERHGVIQADHLPTLSVIPFQIQQLLTNLLSNSLRYAKKNVAAEIQIRAQIVKSHDVPMLKLNGTTAEYHKISITDNGIGFEQQHATVIFDLFHRLHSPNKYQGTGIGLAICKKIIENHAGYILAQSEPNVGTTISFFLPITE
jgi:signal transduction histidine kinase/CHASE3 domain sensor protein